MLWMWYWKAWAGPTLVVGGQFGSLPLILPRFCPDQTILIIAFDPKHRFSHLLYSAIHIHSNLKRIPMATKRFPEGGKKPPCLRFSLPGGMDQRWGVIRSWGQAHGLVWDVIFREVFCVFFLWKEQLGEWGCAHCEAKGFTQGCRQNTKADKWVLRQTGKVDEQKEDKQYVENQDWQIQKIKSGEDHGTLEIVRKLNCWKCFARTERKRAQVPNFSKTWIVRHPSLVCNWVRCFVGWGWWVPLYNQPRAPCVTGAPRPPLNATTDGSFAWGGRGFGIGDELMAAP